MSARVIRNGAPVVAAILPAETGSVRKQFPMLPWFPSSFLASTRGWPLTARGIYRELIDVQWEQGGLPADAAELRELIGATPAEWRHWPRVEPKFPLCSDGLRRNARLEAHRAQAADRSAKATANAKGRWDKVRSGNGGTGGSHANA